MKRAVRNLATVVAFLFLLIPALEAADQAKTNTTSAPSMTLWQARRAVVAGLSARGYRLLVDPRSFRFTLDDFEFDAVVYKKHQQHYKVDLRTLEPVFAQRRGLGWGNEHVLRNQAGRDLAYPLSEKGFWEGDPAAAAGSLAAALNCLRAFAGKASDPFRTFTQQAAAWRALPSKPPIPEKVREQRLLAENAFREKQLEEALIHYETGLEIYPTWPQGYFNAALIAAELGFYAQAVEHMRAYLELVPDAADAQSARDQIDLWQFKAKQDTAKNAGNSPKK
jgi:tetratricopeptide (TPR) repeat protein